MDLPDDTPRLPKLPFIVGDLIFLAAALFLVLTAGSPPSTASIIGIVICVGIGVGLGVAPFLAEYSRAQDRRLDQRQRALEALVRTTAEAADQASIAANGLNEIAENTKQSMRLMESLPLEVKNARQTALSEESNTNDDQFAALRDEITRIEAVFGKLGKTLGAQINGVESKLEAIPVAPTEAIDATPEKAAPEKKKPRKPRKKTVAKAEEESLLTVDTDAVATDAPEPELDLIEPAAEPISPEIPESVADADSDSSADALQEEVSPEAVVSEQSESPGAAESPDSTDTEAEEPESLPASEPTEETRAEPESLKERPPTNESPETDTNIEKTESVDPPTEPDNSTAASEDGKTRLTVTAYIGIGNRLFIRGDGAGLAADEGTPLQFVSIGKWRWESDVASEAVKVTLWKNDEEQCTSVGEIELQPGDELETTANF